MAVKRFQIDEIGHVTVYKRRGTKRIKLSVDHDGNIKLTMPTWLPYRTGLGYVATKQQWLAKQVQQRTPTALRDNQSVGSGYRLHFEPYDGETVRSRILKSKEIRIQYPADLTVDSSVVQQSAQKACIRALRAEAEEVLPGRLKQLAQQNNLRYSSISVRQLKGRWGSCDSNGHITMNLYVMQLPQLLIEYVLLHELAHTEYLDHSANFWAVLTRLDPLAKEHRKQLRDYRPIVNGPTAGDSPQAVSY